MTKFLTASAIALVATAAVAVAQPASAPAAPAEQTMVRGDVQAMVRQHFTVMDTNRDGAITTAEVAARRSKSAEHAVQLGKANRPGGGWQGENIVRDPNAAFDRLDANKDGMISRDEFAKGREMRIEKRIVMREDGAKHGSGMGGGMGGGHMIVMADANHDGRITLAEAEAMALQHSDKMDANHDGQVTRDERRAGRPMMIKMHQAPKAG